MTKLMRTRYALLPLLLLTLNACGKSPDESNSCGVPDWALGGASSGGTSFVLEGGTEEAGGGLGGENTASAGSAGEPASAADDGVADDDVAVRPVTR